jgi:Zn-dependent M28 family amino/carboxypeptidase
VGVGIAVNGDSIYNGADDNASGTSALLEVARALAENRIHRVLVVEKGKLKGIITSLDVIAHFASGGE